MDVRDALDGDALIRALLPAVRAAARLEMMHFARGVVSEKKADKTPVTVADREAEAVLVEALSAIAPGIPVIAEEAAAAGASWARSERFFLVDALDGTRQFVKGEPQFSINVALVVDGRPKWGLILVPPSERLFMTRSDGHAYETRLALSEDEVSLDRLEMRRCASRRPDPGALVAFNSQTAGGATERLLKSLNVVEARPFGSSMKFCMIAAGEGDLYARLGSTCEWDTAAGQAILEAAGGSVTTLDGEPLTYGHLERGYLNPHFVAWGREPLWRRDDEAGKTAST